MGRKTEPPNVFKEIYCTNRLLVHISIQLKLISISYFNIYYVL